MSKSKKKETKKDAPPVEGVAHTPAAKGRKTKKEKAPHAPEKTPVRAADLDVLRKPVDEAKTALAVAEAEANEMTERARGLVATAKDAFRAALAPYREACRKAGRPCEFEGGRGTNISEKVTFQVERLEKGVRVTVKGRPETAKVIPLAALKESVNKCAYAYTDAALGPREKVGNKGGSLSNRLRAALK